MYCACRNHHDLPPTPASLSTVPEDWHAQSNMREFQRVSLQEWFTDNSGTQAPQFQCVWDKHKDKTNFILCWGRFQARPLHTVPTGSGYFLPLLEQAEKKLFSGITVCVLRWKDHPDILSVLCTHTHARVFYGEVSRMRQNLCEVWGRHWT